MVLLLAPYSSMDWSSQIPSAPLGGGHRSSLSHYCCKLSRHIGRQNMWHLKSKKKLLINDNLHSWLIIWYPSLIKVTPSAMKKWPYKRGGLS